MAGVIYKGAGKLGLAKDGFWYSLRFGGANAPALLQLGEIAIHQKDYAGAAKLLRRAVQYNPDDGVALSDLAVALRLGGHFDEASKAANEAVEKMPILPYALAENGTRNRLSGTTLQSKRQRKFSRKRWVTGRKAIWKPGRGIDGWEIWSHRTWFCRLQQRTLRPTKFRR